MKTTQLPDVVITDQQVNDIFKEVDESEKPHQAEVLVRLYKLVYPDWDDIESVDGCPQCSRQLALHCIRKFMEFDEKHHPSVMPSGIWLTRGFGADEKRPTGWRVTPAPVVLKEGVTA